MTNKAQDPRIDEILQIISNLAGADIPLETTLASGQDGLDHIMTALHILTKEHELQMNKANRDVRINDLTEIIDSIASLNFDHKANVNTEDDLLDTVARGLNTISDTLRETTVSRDYLISIMDSMFDCMIITDPHGKITDINRATQNLFGFDKKDLLRRAIDSLVVEAIDTSRAGQEERTIITRSGHHIPVSWSISKIVDVQAHLKGFVYVIQDITERKQIEITLLQSEERYRKISKVMLDTAFSHVYDEEDGVARPEWVIGSLQDLTSYTNEEFYRTIGYKNIIHPDDLDRVLENIALTLEGHVNETEYRITTKSGDIRWLYVKRIPEWDQERQRVVRYYGIGQDITKRKQAEIALLESVTRYRALFEQSHYGIFIHDAITGETIAANQAAADIFECEINDLLNSDPVDFSNAPEDSSRRWHEVINSGTARIYEREFTTVAGNDGLVEIILTPIHNASDEIVLVQASLRDIKEKRHYETEREELVEKLQAQNAELERFTYTVSHDLKSPLVTIQGYLGYLKQDFENRNSERFERDITHIENAAVKMQELLEELLELSRIGRVVNAPEAISFADIVDEALAAVRGQLNERNISFKIVNNLPIVYGDRVRLVEVMQNLLDNAIKYMGEQSHPIIEIGYTSCEEEQVFYVQDNGVGIAADYHDKVFGLFEKLDQSTDGTGVGLAIVRRIVAFHNGRTWVESEGVTKGACFYFSLPHTKP